jgi:hypothetical protein
MPLAEALVKVVGKLGQVYAATETPNPEDGQRHVQRQVCWIRFYQYMR